MPTPSSSTRRAGIFADPDRVHYADYEGQYIRTRGPLAMPHSPQSRPVFLQAGSSPRGREFAARWAEMIFASSHSIADNIAFTTDIKRRMQAYNRAPEECAVLNSMAVVVGETTAIAEEKAEMLHALANEDLVLATNSSMMGADLSRHQTEDALDAAKGNQGILGSQQRLTQMMRAEKT